MKVLFAAVAAMAVSSAAFAEPPKNTEPKRTPVKMTDAQLDSVAAGLITVVAFDVVDVRNNEIIKNVNVAVPANVTAAVGILGNAGAVGVQRSPVLQ
jgi:nitrate/nitrite transporter NarK